MNIRSIKTLAIVSILVLLAGCKAETNECIECSTNTDSLEVENQDSLEVAITQNPLQLLEEIQNGQQDFDFYGSFTEPFWTIYLLGDQVLFNQIDHEPTIHSLDHEFDNTTNSQEISFSKDGTTWGLLITKEGGSDGMSEIVYPYKVVMNNSFFGGGAEEFIHGE